MTKPSSPHKPVSPPPERGAIQGQELVSLEISIANKELTRKRFQWEMIIQEDDEDDFCMIFSPEEREDQARSAAKRKSAEAKKELNQRLQISLEDAKRNRDVNRMKRKKSIPASRIDMLGLALDAFLLEVIQDKEVRYVQSPLQLAVTNILQAGMTTTCAITLLLEHGYVVDADARWRGLYELTCQAAVLSKASDIEEAALRYLMHGQRKFANQRLSQADQNKGCSIVDKELQRDCPRSVGTENQQGATLWERDYQWIPTELLKNGESQKRISQMELFLMADLTAAPSSLVKDSHKSVHMSSHIIAAESAISLELDPGGYDPELERDVAKRTARTLYELVAHCCLLADELDRCRDYTGWMQEFYDRAQTVVDEFS